MNRPLPRSADNSHSPPLSGSDNSFAIALMQHLVVPTFVLNAEGRVLIWNRACERLTGVAADEVVGTRDHGLAFYDQPRPCLADLIVEGRAREIESYYTNYDHSSSIAHGFHAENWCRMPRAGTRLYLAVDAGPIYDDHGKLLAVVETLRDMTVQKDAQMRLEQLAAEDPLTGLANRRAFDERLEREWQRRLRGEQSLAIVLLDVDHFKRYNDTYGHPRGDACLRSVASVLAGVAARTGDLAARYGGEEFVLVLPGTNAAGARVVAERIRAAIEALGIEHSGSSVSSVVTVSLGVAVAESGQVRNVNALLQEADAALYRAKARGRNCVEVADEAEALSAD